MTRLTITLIAIAIGALLCSAYLREREARDHFIDGCKQERSVERCENIWSGDEIQ